MPGLAQANSLLVIRQSRLLWLLAGVNSLMFELEYGVCALLACLSSYLIDSLLTFLGLAGGGFPFRFAERNKQTSKEKTTPPSVQLRFAKGCCELESGTQVLDCRPLLFSKTTCKRLSVPLTSRSKAQSQGRTRFLLGVKGFQEYRYERLPHRRQLKMILQSTVRSSN